MNFYHQLIAKAFGWKEQYNLLGFDEMIDVDVQLLKSVTSDSASKIWKGRRDGMSASLLSGDYVNKPL